MKNIRLSFIILFTLCSIMTYAQRESILLNQDWKFRFSHQVEKNTERRVDLPHTWNAQDALVGKIDYKRGIGNYRKVIFVPEDWKGKRLFLRFEGANTVSNLFMNGRHVGEHRGGYGAFIFEITDKVNYNADNTILVRVNNGEQLDIMPLVGDFNFYGGIYRDVHLLITESVCISPLDYASPGVYLVQNKVTDEAANVTARINLSNAGKEPQKAVVQVRVMGGDKLVYETQKEVTIRPSVSIQQEEVSIDLKRPHLWNGVEDPFMYRTIISLVQNGVKVDEVEQPLGLRYYTTDPNKGFFLNGKHLPLYGVCRHQERAEVGNALRLAHHEEDTKIMREMGVNAIRLAHYPQATAMYDLMDKNGIVAWAEIPFIGPGGYLDKGFVDQLSFRENGKEQLKELIRQHYNHPSICFWGLFNELKEEGDNPIEYIKELNALAHSEDPTRATTSASNQGGAMNFISDLIAWNRYDGWYGATPATLGKFLDDTHARYPELKIGISEYGAGASVYHQQDSLVQTSPTSWWHPENWQTFYHIRNWEILHNRPFVWGSFVWNMFDFGAAHRTEGDRPGINDKGLVTHDRKVKKDAFYFYKANWNKKEPMLYIAGRRNVLRFQPKQTIQVFTTAGEVELFVNGKSVGKRKVSPLAIAEWTDLSLAPGKNLLKAVSNGKPQLTDEITLEYSIR